MGSPHAAIDRLPHGDRSQPARERGRLLELAELLQRLDEHFLRSLLGLGVISQPLEADGLHHPLEPADQLAEGVVVALLRGEHELGGGGQWEFEDFEFRVPSFSRAFCPNRSPVRRHNRTKGSKARERAADAENERVELADDRRRQSLGAIRGVSNRLPQLPGGEATHRFVSPGALQCYGTAGSAGNARFQDARRRRNPMP